MNRIYKVVWSKAKNCYTVVSEIAKRHGNGNRARTCAAAFLAAFALTGVMGMSEVQALDANVVNANTLNAKYNLNVGEMAGNGSMPFFVDSNGAFHAAAKEFSVNKDGKVTATAGEIGGVTIKEGNITVVNAINTSAINTNVLNSKYNLSVGTANENGTMPFFVNSNGAFYAANGKLVVDKDGNVTAGNVVLNNGVHIGHSALRDGELFVGDASGSYSQITPKSAKLGQVTIDEKGNIAGANSIQTNALNAKYNLSVGTANENGTMPFFVNSNGAFYAANGKLVVDKDGNVTAGNVVLNNGVHIGHSALRDGELFVGDASGSYSQITPKSAKLGQVTIDEKGNIAGANSIQTNALNAKYNLSVGTANENGTMPFFVNSNGAFYAANGKLVVDKDGKVTATAGEIGNVVLNNGVYTGNSKLIDGELFVGDASGNYSQITPKSAKLGKVTIDENGNVAGANSIQTNALNAKYNLSVGTANENGTMPFFVNSNGAFYAANGKLVVDKDGKVTATAGEIGNVVLNNGVYTGNSKLIDGELFVGDASGSYSQITPNSAKLGQVTIDEKGNIAGVNSVQTNALNSKYNLSVGTANENGTMPFFVNSTGDFYAANNKFSVNKDGKVTATEGEIGGVKINKGIFYKNTSLRDGSLYLGDDQGNYSQISPEYAKLGKVTIDKEGNITGVKAINTNAINTNALNAKYNLSVGTANENGTMPFFVNSTGDFYAANNKFSVNKDGKVTATEGEIGGVKINKGIFYKNTSLRDGSLYLGDDQGNYSQISPEYAKLGKVTIDKEGNITGVKAINTNAINTNALNAKYNLSVGTANENGTMPFFVNSTGDFYAANNKFSVNKDGKVTATEGEIGGVKINKGIFYKNTSLRDGSLYLGDDQGNYSQISPEYAKLGKVTISKEGKITGVVAGAITADSTDAVNGSQLHAVATEAAKHSKVVNGSNINVEEAELNGQKIYKVGLNDDVLLGKPTGNNVSISGTKGTIETTGYIATKDRIIADKGAQLAGINVSGNIISNGAARIALYGDSGVAGMVNGKGASLYMQDGNTVINQKVAIDQNGKISGVAAGAITADSTDAVNGSQLKQTNDNVAQNKADIAQNKADIAQNKADIAQNKADIAQNKADIA